LAFAAPCQLGGALDRLACAAQRDDALMGGGIGYTPRIFTGSLGKSHTLTLSLAACLVVIGSRDTDTELLIRSSMSYSYAQLLS
jgi:hypothetical protein